MPSGYTADLYEGKDVSFAEFAAKCAHAFGALIELRDHQPTGTLPAVLGNAEHEQKRLSAAVARHAELVALDTAQWQEMEESDRRTHNADVQASIEKAAARRARYESMLARARAWTPPSEEHVGLRDFMITQLEESIRFDCSVTYLDIVAPVSADDFRTIKLAQAQREVDRAREALKEQTERLKARGAWVEALRASLDGAV